MIFNSKIKLVITLTRSGNLSPNQSNVQIRLLENYKGMFYNCCRWCRSDCRKAIQAGVGFINICFREQDEKHFLLHSIRQMASKFGKFQHSMHVWGWFTESWWNWKAIFFAKYCALAYFWMANKVRWNQPQVVHSRSYHLKTIELVIHSRRYCHYMTFEVSVFEVHGHF